MRKRRPPRRRTAKGRPAALAVSGLNAAGEGVAGDVAVPFALPGEDVEAVVSGRTAVVRERRVSSPERALPVCPHFGLPGDGCGGCTLQHLGAEAALRLKWERLLASVRSVYPLAEVAAAHVSPPRSRRRAKLAVGPGRAGLRSLKSRAVVRITDCAVLHPRIFALLRPLERLAHDLGQGFEAQTTVADGGVDLDLLGFGEERLTLEDRERLSAFANAEDLDRLSVEGVVLAERRPPSASFGGTPVALPVGSFLQATAEGEKALQQEVLAGVGDAREIADLYCGMGTFALPLAGEASVYAADTGGAAIAALSAAARRSGRAVETEARDLLARPLMPTELARFGAVVFDPPRAGAPAQAPLIAEAAPERVVAVSCNPRTLARDLGHFSGSYHLSRLVLVDQFGWSPHLEAVACLSRR